MLDDMRVLRDAAEAYRAAATAAGLDWPEPADTPSAPPPDLVHRLFDVDHVPEQLSWLESRPWDSIPLFPNRGYLRPWPTEGTAGESLDVLSLSIGTPFHWRHQIPIFNFSGDVVYTFVLEGEYEGEIWRYLISPDQWDPVRAARSLAALFTEWTKGIGAGVVYYQELGRCLFVGEPAGRAVPFDELWRQAPDVDPLAFAMDVPAPLMRERQRECGVDLAYLDRGFESWEELTDAVLAVRTSLGL
jgi:hypothetical protein